MKFFMQWLIKTVYIILILFYVLRNYQDVLKFFKNLVLVFIPAKCIQNILDK